MIRFVRCKEVTSFWGMEVNQHPQGQEDPALDQPTVGTRLGEKVTFHVIGLGTAFHPFLEGHRWLERGTTSVDTANLGTISRQLRR